MGQKINPTSLRLGIIRNWKSNWYAKDNFAELLKKDYDIRAYVAKKLSQAGVSKVVLDRLANKVIVNIYTARPGVVIGKKGSDIERVKADLAKIAGTEVILNINEVRKPETDAKLVADSIASQIEKRVSFRRAIKKGMQSALRFGAKGIRVNCSGRLGGAEIARMEWYREGRVPLHTIRADVDYGFAEALTTYGMIGVKVWIYKGEIYNTKNIFLPKKVSDRRENASKE